MRKFLLFFISGLALIAGCSKPAAQPCYVCVNKVANTVSDSISYCNGYTPPFGTSAATLSNTYFYDNDGSNVDSSRCYEK